MGAQTKTVLSHAGTAAGAVIATVGFMSDHKVDLYAIWDQLNVVYAAVIKLVALATPFATATYAVYRTTLKARLAEIVKDPNAAQAAEALPSSAGATAVANALTKAAVVLLACLVFVPHSAYALDPVTSSTCDPVRIFKGMTPDNFQARIKLCADDDLNNALADANKPPLDYPALGCLSAVKTMRDAIVLGGAITAFQGFRRAKQSGLIANCLNYVTSTVSLP